METSFNGVLVFPGADRKTHEAVNKLLKENHDRFDIFFNSNDLHNHTSHHLLAAYSLGASADVLAKIFESNASFQRPSPASKVKITSENWTDHLGDDKMWTDYLQFFVGEVKTLGIAKSVEKFVFHDLMIPRSVAGVVHPLIQLGHGIEFQSSLLVAEGIAMMALHNDKPKPILPKSYLSGEASKTGNSSIKDLIEKALNDPRFEGIIKPDQDDRFNHVVEVCADVVNEYTSQWKVEENERDIKEKLKELFITCFHLTFATQRPNKTPKIDFFLMHTFTSILFVAAMVQHFPVKQQATLLRIHFATVFTLWISRGRPRLLIDELRAYKPSKAHPSYEWLDVIKISINSRQTHVPKTMRSLVYADTHFGEEHGSDLLKAAQILVDVVASPENEQKSAEKPAEEHWEMNPVGLDETWA